MAPRSEVRALEVQIEPHDTVPCRTPFDSDAKELRLSEADYHDLDRCPVSSART